MKYFKFVNLLVVGAVLLLAFTAIFYQGVIVNLWAGLFLLGAFQLLSGLILALSGKKVFWRYLLLSISYLLGLVLIDATISPGKNEDFLFFLFMLFPFLIAAYFTYLCFRVE